MMLEVLLNKAILILGCVLGLSLAACTPQAQQLGAGDTSPSLVSDGDGGGDIVSGRWYNGCPFAYGPRVMGPKQL